MQEWAVQKLGIDCHEDYKQGMTTEVKVLLSPLKYLAICCLNTFLKHSLGSLERNFKSFQKSICIIHTQYESATDAKRSELLNEFYLQRARLGGKTHLFF